MVAISKVGNFPRFCPILFGVNSSGTHGPVLQGRGASHVSKWQMCITRTRGVAGGGGVGGGGGWQRGLEPSLNDRLS